MALDYGNGSNFSVKMEGPYGSAGSSSKITQVKLIAANWKNATSPYFQTIEVAGVSESSLINIQATKEQVAQMCIDGIALHMENEAGTVTAWAIGNKPTEDMVLQVSLTEVVSA